MGPLAQWSEHSAHNRSVAGSSPAGPNYNKEVDMNATLWSSFCNINSAIDDIIVHIEGGNKTKAWAKIHECNDMLSIVQDDIKDLRDLYGYSVFFRVAYRRLIHCIEEYKQRG